MTKYQTQLHAIENDPSCSYWLKEAARQLNEKDPIDAYYDAHTLMEVMKLRMDMLTGRSS